MVSSNITLTSDRAATVSVAQSTLLSSITSLVLSIPSKQNVLNRLMKAERTMKLSRVPTIPKKLMIPKFSKKRDLRRLYPAAKMMGGRMNVKKISLLNSID